MFGVDALGAPLNVFRATMYSVARNFNEIFIFEFIEFSTDGKSVDHR